MKLLLLAALALPLLAQSEVGSRVSALTVTDSSPEPKTLGELDPTGNYVVMWFTRPMIIGVNMTSIPEGNAVLFYEASACQGQAYTKTPPAYAFLTRPLILGPLRTVYVNPTTATTLIRPTSRYAASTGCQAVTMNTIAMTPVSGLVNLYDIFVPPFHVTATTY